MVINSRCPLSPFPTIWAGPIPMDFRPECDFVNDLVLGCSVWDTPSFHRFWMFHPDDYVSFYQLPYRPQTPASYMETDSLLRDSQQHLSVVGGATVSPCTWVLVSTSRTFPDWPRHHRWELWHYWSLLRMSVKQRWSSLGPVMEELWWCSPGGLRALCTQQPGRHWVLA